MCLKEYCKIKTGMVLSRKSTEESIFKYKQLTLKAVQNDGSILHEELNTYYAVNKLNDNCMTQIDDIVVRLTAPFTAVCIKEKDAGIVVSSNFVIIKADVNNILPEYIAWYINQDKIKKQLLSNRSGVLLQIKPSFISDIKISPPSLDIQEKVVDFAKLSQKEIKLFENLIKEKKKYYNGILRRINKMK